MCIVSYVPTSTGFMLTFNRNEVFTRASSSPQKYAKKRQNYITQQINSMEVVGLELMQQNPPLDVFSTQKENSLCLKPKAGAYCFLKV
jgi:hypothetical protein